MTATEWNAIYLSVRIALLAVLVGLPPAIFLGWLLSRHRFWGKSVLETLLSLPLVLPPVVTGYLLLMAFSPKSILGRMLTQIGVTIPFTLTAATLAATVVSFPLLLRSIQVAFGDVDQRFEHAARTLGASPLKTLWTITLPLSWRGILVGMLLAFTRSLGEFGATIVFAGNTPGITQTIPIAIYSFDQAGTSIHENMALRLVCVSIALALLATGLGNYFLRTTTEKREK